MGKLLRLPIKTKTSDTENNTVLSTLERLLVAAHQEKIKSLIFLVEDASGAVSYGLQGQYRYEPEKSYIACCTAMYSLCNYIHKVGESSALI